MQELSTTVNGRMFTFKKLSAVDMLKTQQTLLRKIKVDDELMGMIKQLDNPSEELGEDGLAKSGNENMMFVIYMLFLRLIQSFDEDELINFMNGVVSKAMVMRLTDAGHKRLTNIDQDFEDNCNGMFELMFNVLKENYKFDFFLKKTTIDENAASTIKVKRGNNT